MTKKKIIFIITIAVFCIISFFGYKIQNSEYNVSEEDIFVKNTTDTTNLTIVETSISKIKVHVIGEIVSPGLYELDEGDRINDLISLAGGKTQNADLSKVNLAYQLSDGDKIYIPSISDEISTYIYNDAGENVLIEGKTSDTHTKKININKASVEELENISGIGPSLASKIISYRDSNGKFNSIEELKNVSGIGNKKFESIKEYITVK